ncbi:MAG TPA: spermidine/putrescine ABC transporter substrate-binding protein [Microbacteriaceae bacterium]|nr:spermidine/putrescine ABC transporter substrate-binding protein [Microbacteriaceae bacterium]
MSGEDLAERIAKEVSAWLLWLPKWRPQTHRGRVRLCKRCTGSPIAQAAGFDDGVPHQVVHSLLTRMHRIIDKEVDKYTLTYLPLLKSELDGLALWKSGSYDPRSGLPEETADLDPDLLFEEGDHPVLFTFAELEEAINSDPVLPMPPLSAEEKSQLSKEVQLADNKAAQVGQELCLILTTHKSVISEAVMRFIEPQIQQLIDELSRSLETP